MRLKSALRRGVAAAVITRNSRQAVEAVFPDFSGYLRVVLAREDVARVLPLLRPLDYGARTPILPGVELALRDAGHILGSSIVELWADGRKLVFSGDLGPKGTPILRDPEAVAEADLVLMESTYGDRRHRDRAATVRELGAVFAQAWAEGGSVLIPAFARWPEGWWRCTSATRNCSTSRRGRCGGAGPRRSACPTCA